MSVDTEMSQWRDEAADMAHHRNAEILTARAVELGHDVTRVTLGEEYRHAFETLLEWVKPVAVVAWVEIESTARRRFENLTHRLLLGT